MPRRHAAGAERRVARASLTGKLFDATGEPMSPTFSRGKSGRSYRYYVSSALQKGSSPSDKDFVRRVPAREIELLVVNTIARWVPGETEPMQLVQDVRLNPRGLQVTVCGDRAAAIMPALLEGESIIHATRRRTTVQLELALPLRGGRRRIVAGKRPQARIDPALVVGLRRAHAMIRRDRVGLPVIEEAPLSHYDRQLLRLAFLAPDIQGDIMAGQQPPGLTLESLRQIDMPLAWTRQRAALGWGEPGLPVKVM